MPDLGYDVEEGTLATWVVAVGAEVSEGQVIAEIEGDKTTLELEAPRQGTVVEILRGEGDVVPVGGVIALIETPDA